MIEVKTYWNGEVDAQAEAEDVGGAMLAARTLWDETVAYRGGTLTHSMFTTISDMSGSVIIKRIEGRRP